jgi:hypothetical protein
MFYFKESLSENRRVFKSRGDFTISRGYGPWRRVSGLPHFVFLASAGAPGEIQPKDLPMLFTANNNQCCYEDVFNEYMYVFVKAIADNDKLFKNYFFEGALIQKEMLGQLPITDKNDVHPGALTYLKSR